MNKFYKSGKGSVFVGVVFFTSAFIGPNEGSFPDLSNTINLAFGGGLIITGAIFLYLDKKK